VGEPHNEDEMASGTQEKGERYILGFAT